MTSSTPNRGLKKAQVTDEIDDYLVTDLGDNFDNLDSHKHAGEDITSGTVARARLGSGSDGSGDNVLHDDGTWGAVDLSSQVTGVAAYGNLGTGGDGSGDHVLTDDGTWSTSPPSAAGDVTFTPAGGIAATDVQAALEELDSEALKVANDLSDLNDAATARTNIGLGNVANVDQTNGSNISSGTVAAARIASLDAAKITTGTLDTARLGSATANADTYLRGDQSWASLDASDISTGTLNAARLPDTYATAADLTDHIADFDTHTADTAIHSSGRRLGRAATATGVENVTGASNTILTALDLSVTVSSRPVYLEFFSASVVQSATSSVGNLTIELLDRTGGANTVLAKHIILPLWTNATSGTATVASGSTSVNVSHNVGETPRAVHLVPSSDWNTSGMTRWWVGTIGSSTFTINANAAGSNLTGDQTFLWSAESKVQHINYRLGIELSSLTAGSSYTFGVRYSTGSSSTWSILSSGGAGALLGLTSNQAMSLTVVER